MGDERRTAQANPSVREPQLSGGAARGGGGTAIAGDSLAAADTAMTDDQIAVLDFSDDALPAPLKPTAQDTQVSVPTAPGGATGFADHSVGTDTSGRHDIISDAAGDFVAEQINQGRQPLLGSYRVLGLLGQGGMGNVYRAVDLNLKRHVALKVIAKKLAQHREMRFVLEAQVTGLLEHPGIVPVHALGTTPDGRPWYTMKLISGCTLADWLYERLPDGRMIARRTDRPSLEKFLRVLIRCCEAVGYSHSRGVIHRDLKPTNIMLGEFGETLVLDWGLAKVLPGSPLRAQARQVTDGLMSDFDELEQPAEGLTKTISLLTTTQFVTQEGRVCGTAEYMPPEQAAGLVDRIDGRADIYALGVILYEMLCGARPTPAARRPPSDVVPPERVNPTWNIPPELSDICVRALKYDPRDRISSSVAMAEELEGFLAGRPPWRSVINLYDRVDEYAENFVDVIGQWAMQDGVLQPAKQSYSGGLVTPGMPLVCMHRKRIAGDFRIEAVGRVLPNSVGELSVLLGVPDDLVDPQRVLQSGYLISLGANWNTRSALRRSGMDVQLEHYRVVPDRPLHVAVEFSGGRIHVAVDGRTVFDYEDRFPLNGERFGFVSVGPGTRWQNIEVWTRGTPLSVSVLTVPDAFYRSARVQEAESWYRTIADDHAMRAEGRLASFKAGLCALQRGDRDEADRLWSALALSPDSALMWIGWATAEQKDPLEELRVILDGMFGLREQPGIVHLAQYVVERAIASTQRQGGGLTLPFYLAAAEADSPVRGLAMEHIYSYLADGVWPGANDVQSRLEALGQLSAVAERFSFTRPWLEALITKMEIDLGLLFPARERLMHLKVYDDAGLAPWRKLLRADWNQDQGYIDVAQDGYERLAEDAPARVSYTAHNRLGKLHYTQGREQAAIQAFLRVVEAPLSEQNGTAKRYAWNTLLGMLIARRKFAEMVEIAEQFRDPRLGISFTLTPLVAMRGAYALWNVGQQGSALSLLENVSACTWTEMSALIDVLRQTLLGQTPNRDAFRQLCSKVGGTLSGCVAFLIADAAESRNDRAGAAAWFRMSAVLLGDSPDGREAEHRARALES